uniref:Putative secreted protein n=1 Tax=Amblyomma parvum TaxID=251391 RepID=A0A023G2C4_AMBPA
MWRWRWACTCSSWCSVVSVVRNGAHLHSVHADPDSHHDNRHIVIDVAASATNLVFTARKNYATAYEKCAQVGDRCNQCSRGLSTLEFHAEHRQMSIANNEESKEWKVQEEGNQVCRFVTIQGE